MVEPSAEGAANAVGSGTRGTTGVARFGQSMYDEMGSSTEELPSCLALPFSRFALFLQDCLTEEFPNIFGIPMLFWQDYNTTSYALHS